MPSYPTICSRQKPVCYSRPFFLTLQIQSFIVPKLFHLKKSQIPVCLPILAPPALALLQTRISLPSPPLTPAHSFLHTASFQCSEGIRWSLLPTEAVSCLPICKQCIESMDIKYLKFCLDLFFYLSFYKCLPLFLFLNVVEQ